MAVSFLRTASVAVPALLLAMTASAADTDRPAGPSIRTVGAKVQITRSIKTGSLNSLRDVVVRRGDFGRGQTILGIDRLPHPIHRGAGLNAMSGDRIVQDKAAVSTLGVTAGTSVMGLGNGFVGPAGAFVNRYAPPDTVGAIGATQYLQVVNVALAVFDKNTKAAVLGPVPTNSLWQGFGGPCEADNDGDATVVYDKAAQRWVVSQFAVETTFAQCVAVSKTSDATGGWWLYEFDTPGNDFPDYPKMGVWPDAYYETFNMFGFGFDGALVCAYDRAKMLTGAAATQQCFQLSSDVGGVLPADLDGHTAPPAGSPNYMVDFNADDSLNLRKFHVDFAHPENTALSDATVVPVASFIGACNFGGSCVKEKTSPLNKLDSLGDRMMYRLAYRNFGDHESLVATHSVDVGTTARTARTGVRWYELRSPGTSPVVYQQSTYSPDAVYRWMPSIAMDKVGDIAVGYTASGTSVDPSVRYTGRLASDPLNTLQAETTMVTGIGSQRIGLRRWGDYSAMTVDPADDCTFWYTQEYMSATGTFNWTTRIGSFKFPTCH